MTTPTPTPETEAIILECEESGTFQEYVDTLTDFAPRDRTAARPSPFATGRGG